VLTSSATDNGAVTDNVCVLLVATKVATIINSANGHTYFETAGTTLAYSAISLYKTAAATVRSLTAPDTRHVFSVNELTAVDQWDSVWAGDVRLRLPSPLNISVRDQQRLLAKHVRPHDRFLEIGCAPGKMLAWVAAVLQADVSGLDYSERGISTAKRLFGALHLKGDLRCESLNETTFPPDSFDIVYSGGLIEHFKDPRGVVRAHLQFLKPGGTALMTVPNYRGIYGRLQRYFDADSLLLHNLEIMTCEALRALAPPDETFEVRTYAAGRMSPWVLTPTKRWPRPVALGISHLVNAAALLQPFDVSFLCPTLVLEIRRRKA